MNVAIRDYLTKNPPRKFWKINLYIFLGFILYDYTSQLIYILERYYNNEFVRWIIPRCIWISLVFVATFIVFYYVFFKDYFSRNYLFILCLLIIGYPIILFIVAQVLNNTKAGDWLSLGQNLVLAL